MNFYFIITTSLALYMLASCEQVRFPKINLVNSTVSFDLHRGASLAKPLDRQAASMSIECASIVPFLGDVNAVNQYTFQLLENVRDRSGVSPILRLGGTTFDSTIFCENCPASLVRYYKPNSTSIANITYSKGLFQILDQNLGPNQKYLFQLNLGFNNFEIAQAQLKGSLKYLDQSHILAYEVGNEPNTYAKYFFNRPANWTVLDYAKQMLDWLPQLRLIGGATFPGFQFGTLVGPPTDFDPNFSLVQLTAMNVPQDIGGIKTLASHAYPEVGGCAVGFDDTIQVQELVNHMSTVQYFSQWESEIAAAESIGVDFHMGETNTASCHGKDGVSNTVGALIWMIDYTLLSATLGMKRIFFHNGVGGFFYNLWEPIAVNSTTPRHINPGYFNLLFAADLISDLSSPQVYRIKSLDTYNLAHYAIYQGEELAKLVILNTDFYNDTSIPRPYKTINVSPVLGNKIKFRRLTAASTMAKNGVTWAGQSVDIDGHVINKLVIEESSVGSVQIFASEAIIVECK